MKTNKIAADRGWSSLLVGVLLASVTAFMLALVGKTEIESGIEQVLMIISGMTTIGALAAFKRVGELMPKPAYSGGDVSFNEAWIAQSLREDGQTNITIDTNYQVLHQPSKPWDLSLDRLVGTDNSLALAKLRLEIERELRRIAHKNGIDIDSRPVGVVRLAEELISRNIIPATWLGGLREIIEVCNQAVHGVELSDEVAASVVRVGGQLLEQLRLMSEEG